MEPTFTARVNGNGAPLTFLLQRPLTVNQEGRREPILERQRSRPEQSVRDCWSISKPRPADGCHSRLRRPFSLGIIGRALQARPVTNQGGLTVAALDRSLA